MIKKDEYYEDIKTIKSILTQVDERSIMESWSFFAYGVISITGIILHQIFYWILKFSFKDLALFLWLPVIILVCLLETISGLTRMKKEGTNFQSRTFLRFFASFIGPTILSIILIALLLRLDHAEYIPTVLLISIGSLLTIYGQLSYILNYLPASLLYVSGVIYFVLELHSDFAHVFAGVLIGFCFFMAGIIQIVKERGREK